jgi:hypothetical protein
MGYAWFRQAVSRSFLKCSFGYHAWRLDILLVRAVHFYIIIVAAGSNYDPLGVPLLPLFAAFGAFLSTFTGGFEQCPPATVGDHFPIALNKDKLYNGLVSPNKRNLLRSNRHVTEKTKSTMFNCHQASIGTSHAYRLVHMSDGGFQNVRCTLRDLQNYYHDLRS